jgi:hypothetical protein
VSELRVPRITHALRKKGFEAYESHHLMYWLVVEGRKTAIRTRISHGERKVDDWLLGQMAKQLHLSKQELLDFIECRIGGEQYVKLMIERGHLRP